MELGRWSSDLNVSPDFKGKHHIYLWCFLFFVNFDSMEILVVVILIVVWMVYEYIRAPFYDSKREVFYKKKKK